MSLNKPIVFAQALRSIAHWVPFRATKQKWKTPAWLETVDNPHLHINEILESAIEKKTQILRRFTRITLFRLASFTKSLHLPSSTALGSSFARRVYVLQAHIVLGAIC